MDMIEKEEEKYKEFKKIYSEVLNRFLEAALKRGLSEAQIKQKLIEKGWPQGFIEKYYSDYIESMLLKSYNEMDNKLNQVLEHIDKQTQEKEIKGEEQPKRLVHKKQKRHLKKTRVLKVISTNYSELKNMYNEMNNRLNQVLEHIDRQSQEKEVKKEKGFPAKPKHKRYLKKIKMLKEMSANYSWLKNIILKDTANKIQHNRGVLPKIANYLFSGLHRYAVLDEDALLLALANKIPLMQTLNKEFKSKIKIAVTPYTLKELIRISKESKNKKLKEDAITALWLVRFMPILGNPNLPKEEMYAQLGKKNNVRLIIQNKTLIREMCERYISTYQIQLSKKKDYSISKKF